MSPSRRCTYISPLALGREIRSYPLSNPRSDIDLPSTLRFGSKPDSPEFSPFKSESRTMFSAQPEERTGTFAAINFAEISPRIVNHVVHEWISAMSLLNKVLINSWLHQRYTERIIANPSWRCWSTRVRSASKIMATWWDKRSRSETYETVLFFLLID